MGKFLISIVLFVLLYLFLAFNSLRGASLSKLVMDITCDSQFAFSVPSEKYLKEYKDLSKVSSKDKTQTLLQYILAGYDNKTCDNEKIKELVRFFVDRGLDINEIGPSGTTVLHDAIIWKEKELAGFLIDLGADTSVFTREKAGYGVRDSFELNQYLMKKNAEFQERIELQMFIRE